MIHAKLGNSSFSLDDSGPHIFVIVRRNSDGEYRFHVPRELFEAYAAARIEDVGHKLVSEAMRSAPKGSHDV